MLTKDDCHNKLRRCIDKLTVMTGWADSKEEYAVKTVIEEVIADLVEVIDEGLDDIDEIAYNQGKEAAGRTEQTEPETEEAAA